MYIFNYTVMFVLLVIIHVHTWKPKQPFMNSGFPTQPLHKCLDGVVVLRKILRVAVEFRSAYICIYTYVIFHTQRSTPRRMEAKFNNNQRVQARS